MELNSSEDMLKNLSTNIFVNLIKKYIYDNEGPVPCVESPRPGVRSAPSVSCGFRQLLIIICNQEARNP